MGVITQAHRSENAYVSSPCRKSMYGTSISATQQQPMMIPLYETVRPKSTCFVTEASSELNLKGKDYMPLSSIVQGHYRQKSEGLAVLQRPPMPPQLPPNRPLSSVGAPKFQVELEPMEKFSYVETEVPLRRVIEAEAAGALRAPAVTCVPWLRKMNVVKGLKKKIGQIGSVKIDKNLDHLPSLKFDTNELGKNVQISADGTRASRIRSFREAIVFSDRPIEIREKVCIRLRDVSTYFKEGVFRFGLTTVNPMSLKNKLPQHLCPDLTRRPGFWARTFDDHLAQPNSLMTFHVTKSGSVKYRVDGVKKGILFSGVDTRSPVWMVLDVYGNTTSLELIDPRNSVIANNLKDEVYAPAYQVEQEPRYVTRPMMSSVSSISRASSQLSHVPIPIHSHSHIQACSTRIPVVRTPEYQRLMELKLARLPMMTSNTVCSISATNSFEPKSSCSSQKVPPPYKTLPSPKSSCSEENLKKVLKEKGCEPEADSCTSSASAALKAKIQYVEDYTGDYGSMPMPSCSKTSVTASPPKSTAARKRATAQSAGRPSTMSLERICKPIRRRVRGFTRLARLRC